MATAVQEPQGGGSAVDRELSALRRRFGGMTEAAEGEGRRLGLSLHITDPDFKLELTSGLILDVFLPAAYPAEAAEVSVVNEDLSPAVRVAMDKAICALRDVIRFIDNNFAMIHECALEVATSLPPAAPSDGGKAHREAQSEGGGGGAGQAPKETVKGAGKDATAEDEWSVEQQAALERALKEVPSSIEAGERWKLIAEKVEGKTKKQCVTRFKALQAALRAKSQPAKQGGGADERSSEGVEEKKNCEEWSKEDQERLEAALKEFPSGGGMESAERWARIAARVPGKSREQCVTRYRALREQLLAAAKDLSKQKDTKPKKEEKVSTFKFTMDDAPPPAAERDSGKGADEGVDEEAEEEADEEGGWEGEGEEVEFLPLEEGAKEGASQVKLNDLMLLGADAAQLLQSRVQCACSKCGEAREVTLGRGGGESGGECKRCKQSMSVALHADVLHGSEGGTCAGWIQVHGGRLVDCLRMQLLASCSQCGSGIRFANVVRGARREANCTSCHAAVSVGFGSLSLSHPATSAPPRAPRNQGANRRDKNGFELIEGSALPNKGACDHYKRSYRWLRFPCCQRLFPCDVCHETQSDSCPAGTWANRMVCGACSKETSYSNKPCPCGMKFGTNAATHWEGGKGCRDKTTMSNKDSKKYANSAFKTQSKKSMRVGQAGAGK